MIGSNEMFDKLPLPSHVQGELEKMRDNHQTINEASYWRCWELISSTTLRQKLRQPIHTVYKDQLGEQAGEKAGYGVPSCRLYRDAKLD